MTTLAALFLGFIASFAIEFIKTTSKKFGVEVRGKGGLLILAMVSGLTYGLFFYIVPKEVQTSIVEYMGTAMSTAMLVYEFLLKNEKSQ